MFELKHITKIFSRGTPDEKRALNDLSLILNDGDFVTVIGGNGAGKSTMQNVISGAQTPEEGQVLLDGKPLPERGYSPVQMIYQHPEQAVNPRLRMRNVFEEGDQVETELIKKLGIEHDWMNRFPTELSGGELQRFCIARALGKRTRFLLADEISTMLDLITQSQIWHFLMEETQRRGIGMIVVSHSPELVEKVCTRVVELK